MTSNKYGVIMSTILLIFILIMFMNVVKSVAMSYQFNVENFQAWWQSY